MNPSVSLSRMNISSLFHTATLLSLLLLTGCKQPASKTTDDTENTSAYSQKSLTDISAESQGTQAQLPSSSENKKVQIPARFLTTDWVDLMPKDDLDALLNPPEYLNEITENSIEDKLNEVFQNANVDDPYQQALRSTRVISGVNNVAIKIPAFIVPLEFDDEQRITQFFMVPFFGACMHLPPPPPNQTIFVNHPQGLTLESIAEPYFISGVLKTSLVKNDMAIAAYSLEMHAFEKYYEEGD